VGEIKIAFEPPGEKSEQVIFIPDACNVVAEVQKDPPLLLEDSFGKNGQFRFLGFCLVTHGNN
jgi:hypothetical protein